MSVSVVYNVQMTLTVLGFTSAKGMRLCFYHCLFVCLLDYSEKLLLDFPQHSFDTTVYNWANWVGGWVRGWS